MKSKKSIILNYLKIFSIILSFSIFSTSIIYAKEISNALGEASITYQVENCNSVGFIEPISNINDSYVQVNTRKYNNTQLWIFQYQYNGYHAIKSTLGELYLHVDNSANDSSIKIDNNNNNGNYFFDNYLWKITVVGSGLFYKTVTISSKLDESKYLTITNGLVSLVDGLGSGRETATRYWNLNETNLKNLKNEFSGNSNSNIKPITFANIYDPVQLNDDSFVFGYFGEYINGTSTDVLQSCRNIGTSSILEYDGFNDRGLVDIISQSSLCVVSTHGLQNSLTCAFPSFNDSGAVTSVYDTSLSSDYINENLPDGYFNTTKCVLLSACLAGSGSPNSITDTLHEKGVETVVGFKKSIPLSYNGTTGEVDSEVKDQLFIQTFLQSLGNGETVNDAVADAYSSFEDYLTIDDILIAGNAQLVLKN